MMRTGRNTLPRVPARRRTLLALVLACGLAGAGATAAPNSFEDESGLSVAVQYPLILKILQFDRNLAARSGDEIVIAAVYQGRYRASTRVRDEVHRAAESSPGRVADLPVRVVDIDIEQTSLRDAIKSLGVDVVYVAPLRAMDIASITAVTRELGVATVTGVEDYVHEGISVGLGVRQEKPCVLVNLDASKAEGVDFSSRLLSLAQLVK
ncbi:MAG TPA: YfiR family protein [Candidatus Krumholzibacteria bacterium]